MSAFYTHHISGQKQNMYKIVTIINEHFIAVVNMRAAQVKYQEDISFIGPVLYCPAVEPNLCHNVH